MTSELPAAPAAPPRERRLHPAEIVLAALDNVRELLIAVVAGLVLGGGASALSPVLAVLLGLAGVVLVLFVGWLRWSTTSYWVANDAVQLRTGIVSPDETSVPLARIQAIDTTQGPVQRLFGVHELHVQTAGGGAKGEIVLRAVSAEATRVLRAEAGLAEPEARDLPEWRLSPRGLVVAALTTPQIGVLLPLVGGLAALLDDLLLTERGNSRLIDRLPDDPVGIALVAAAVAAATLIVSFLGAVVAFSGFTLVRDGERLQIRRGFLQRRAASIPLAQGPRGGRDREPRPAAVRPRSRARGDGRLPLRGGRRPDALPACPARRRAGSAGRVRPRPGRHVRAAQGAARPGAAPVRAPAHARGRRAGRRRHARAHRPVARRPRARGAGTRVGPACATAPPAGAWTTVAWWSATARSPGGR